MPFTIERRRQARPAIMIVAGVVHRRHHTPPEQAQPGRVAGAFLLERTRMGSTTDAEVAHALAGADWEP